MEIVVTGASGFVGRSLCPILETAGVTVRRAARDVTSDIGEHTEWGPIVEGASAVIHLAAHVHIMRSEHNQSTNDEDERYRVVNTLGSEQLARAADRAGVRRFIFLSTAKVMGEASTNPLTAADPVNPQGIYAQSKWDAEQAVAAAVRTMELVILRPPLVYGPHVRGNFLRVMQVIERGVPLPLGATSNLRSLIFVGNLSGAIHHALTAPAGVYLPTDREDMSTSDLIRRLASAMNRPARLFAVPPALLSLCAHLVGRGEEYQKLAGSLQLDGKMPGWEPTSSVLAGLQATAHWFCEARQMATTKEVD
jgi:nucleoside-diphosphate-sugar epimerase